MVPIQESYSIVILGAWNPSIFTPEWVLEHLADDSEAQVDIAFPLDDPTAPRRISFEGILIFPGRKRIMFTPNEATVEGLINCAKVAEKLLSLLPHTPLASLGLNFAFLASEGEELDPSPFTTPDIYSIANDYVTVDETINRSLHQQGKDYLLNYSIARGNSGTRISFNCHYDTNDAESMKNVFVEGNINSLYEEVISFSKSHYDLELED